MIDKVLIKDIEGIFGFYEIILLVIEEKKFIIIEDKGVKFFINSKKLMIKVYGKDSSIKEIIEEIKKSSVILVNEDK